MNKRDAPLHLMKMKVNKAPESEKLKLQAELDLMNEARQYAHQSIRSVVQHLCSEGHCQYSEGTLDQRSSPITRHDCAEKLIHTFNLYCFNLAKNPYTTKYLHAMVNIAEGLESTNFHESCYSVSLELARACEQMISANKYEQIL